MSPNTSFLITNYFRVFVKSMIKFLFYYKIGKILQIDKLTHLLPIRFLALVLLFEEEQRKKVRTSYSWLFKFEKIERILISLQTCKRHELPMCSMVTCWTRFLCGSSLAQMCVPGNRYVPRRYANMIELICFRYMAKLSNKCHFPQFLRSCLVHSQRQFSKIFLSCLIHTIWIL